MRHNRRVKRLGRTHTERKALLESLVGHLMTHQAIKTTLAKAKAAKPLADHLITLGKQDTLHARRQVFSFLQDHQLTSKVFKEVAPRFKDRQGGYTRILQLNNRKGDNAQMALLELTEKEIKAKVVKKKAKDQKAEKATGHEGHDHEHGKGHSRAKEDEAAAKPEAAGAKETFARHPESKAPKPKGGFFKNLGKFFKNKGGG